MAINWLFQNWLLMWMIVLSSATIVNAVYIIILHAKIDVISYDVSSLVEIVDSPLKYHEGGKE